MIFNILNILFIVTVTVMISAELVKRVGVARILKIVLINIINIIAILVIAELAANIWAFGRITGHYSKVMSFAESYQHFHFRPVSGENYAQKPPVVLFGCSFTYGSGIEYAETLGYKLAGTLKRTVYNRGISTCGIQHAIWQLEHEPLLDRIPKPEYVIYTFIPDHIRRLDLFVLNYDAIKVSWFNYPYLRYYEKNGELVQDKSFLRQILYHSTFLKLAHVFCHKTDYPAFNTRYHQYIPLLDLHLKTLSGEIKKKWPNTKFIVLVYDNWLNSDLVEVYADLRKQGVTILDAGMIFGVPLGDEKYIVPNDIHPSGAAWDAIVPGLVKELLSL